VFNTDNVLVNLKDILFIEINNTLCLFDNLFNFRRFSSFANTIKFSIRILFFHLLYFLIFLYIPFCFYSLIVSYYRPILLPLFFNLIVYFIYLGPLLHPPCLYFFLIQFHQRKMLMLPFIQALYAIPSLSILWALLCRAHILNRLLPIA
jgi:hypothetical protein